jgi:hypothetical protein
MTYMIEFRHTSEKAHLARELLKALGGLEAGAAVHVKGAWVAVQTGSGYALVDATDAVQLYAMCARWADIGEVNVIPVVPVAQVP